MLRQMAAAAPRCTRPVPIHQQVQLKIHQRHRANAAVNSTIFDSAFGSQ
jgi:hypothetical protein